MVLDHLSPGMALRTLVSTARTTSADKVLSLSHHPIPKEALPQPGFGSFDSLVSGCRHLMAKTQYLSSQFSWNNQNSFLLSPLLYLLPEDLVTIQMQQTPVDVIVLNSWAGQKQFALIRFQFPPNQSKIRPNSGSLDWLRLISSGVRPTRDVGPSESPGETPMTQAN